MEFPAHSERGSHNESAAAITLIDVSMIMSILIALANLMKNRESSSPFFSFSLTQSHTA